MRIRAKCKLCQDIIESFHRYDYVSCKCGHISIDGGLEQLKCSAIDWNNFLRVDDEGNEIVPIIKDKKEMKSIEELESIPPPSKKELLGMLDEMIASYERLPEHAKSQSPTNYDLAAALLLILHIMRCK